MATNYIGKIVTVLITTGFIAFTLLNGVQGQGMQMLTFAGLAGILAAATAREFTPPSRRKRRRLPGPLRRWVSSYYGPEAGSFAAVLRAAAAAHFLTILVVSAALYALLRASLWASETLWESLLWPSAALIGVAAAFLGSRLFSQEPDELLRAYGMEPLNASETALVNDPAAGESSHGPDEGSH